MGFIDTIKARAKADKKTIVLPESEDRRTYEAAAQILKEDLANLIIIGSEEAVKKGSEGLDVSKATIVDPEKNEKTQAYVDKLVELRAKKGMTPEKARETILNDYTYYGVMMVKMGDADGLVSGACHSTANTLRPCLQILKTKPGTKLVSAFFLMVVPDCEYGDDGVFVFGDCGLNQNPNPEELAAIAESSAESYRMLTGNEPRVAMLPQPYVTTAQMQMEGLKVALDMTEEWDKVSPDSALVTGVVVARKEFVEQNEAAFNEFLEDYKASTEFVNANVDEAAALVAGYEIVPKEPIAQKALPECNITFISGADMKAKVSGYLKVLYDQNPEAVGGTLPDDAFYYGA